MSDAESSLAAALSGRYRIDRVLGAGGMATVYLAHDLKHDRPVALKVLKPELAHALGPERFEREIKLAARLQHPHILTVLDSGRVEVESPEPRAEEKSSALGSQRSALYFTMPYVEGESLRDRLTREKQLPVEDAVRIAREAAQALQYAHEHGVIHRDIKPENLLLTRDGSTLVADFGIARALGGAGGETLTATGASIGTPAYMSPEQASGEHDLDARTDLFSLAIVLYEMLAGETPFAAATAQATIARRFVDTPRPLRVLRPAVPLPVEAAVARALERTPADRHASIRQFADALGASTTAPATAITPAPVSRPRLSRAATLGIGILLGLGVLFAWRQHAGGADAPSGLRRIAVLPFENLGDSADAYFADGITDAVRGKLSSVPGLMVIAPASSNEYRGTTRSMRDVARDLGVDYLLQGKVRWSKSAGSMSRVQVSPTLVASATQSVAWQQPFDAELSDVFQVQAAIADQVANALQVVVGDSARQEIERPPTDNLAAYDAYLRGKALGGDMTSTAPVEILRAITYLEQAVALDSTFALAWAELSIAQATIYLFNDPVPGRLEVARSAVARALRLAPTLAEAWLAQGRYFYVQRDERQSLAAYRSGLAAAPRNVELQANAAVSELSLGDIDSAIVHLRQAAMLDPRSLTVARRLGSALRWARRLPEAAAELDRGLQLAPNNIPMRSSRVMVELARGDLAAARAVVAAAPPEVDPIALITNLSAFGDLYWVLDDAQQRILLRLTPAAFADDRPTWALALAETWWMRGDRAKAAAYADTAARLYTERLRVNPEDGQSFMLLGVALAYAGRREDAFQSIERGRALTTDASGAGILGYFGHQRARIYVITGDYERALDELERLLAMPYDLTPGWLRIDPNFAPLKSNPRFRKLVAERS